MTPRGYFSLKYYTVIGFKMSHYLQNPITMLTLLWKFYMKSPSARFATSKNGQWLWLSWWNGRFRYQKSAVRIQTKIKKRGREWPFWKRESIDDDTMSLFTQFSRKRKSFYLVDKCRKLFFPFLDGSFSADGIFSGIEKYSKFWKSCQHQTRLWLIGTIHVTCKVRNREHSLTY